MAGIKIDSGPPKALVRMATVAFFIPLALYGKWWMAVIATCSVILIVYMFAENRLGQVFTGIAIGGIALVAMAVWHIKLPDDLVEGLAIGAAALTYAGFRDPIKSSIPIFGHLLP